MPIVNTAGKLTRLEGGDIATIALMAAFMANDDYLNDENLADAAVASYTAVVEHVHQFNQSMMKRAVGAGIPADQPPAEIVAQCLAYICAAVNTVPVAFRETSAWYRDSEKLLKENGYVRNDDGVWARAGE